MNYYSACVLSHFSSEPVESAEWDPEHQSCLVSPAPGVSLGSEQGQASSAENFLVFSSVVLQTQTSDRELHKNLLPFGGTKDARESPD